MKILSTVAFDVPQNSTAIKSCTAKVPFGKATKMQSENDIYAWLNDKDKICTDGADDGKISAAEAAKSFGKGLIGIVKTSLKHPFLTAGTIAMGVGLTILTGGAALPVMTAIGIASGAGMIAKGIYSSATAKTDGEAKQGWETIGNGTFALGTSVLSAKGSLKAAAEAGVQSAKGAENLNAIQASTKVFKTVPEAVKVSGLNAKGNFLTITTGVISKNSNAMRALQKNSHHYMSKANEAQAYRFNPNGTDAEILQNNPGVFQGEDGKFYIPNKWSPDEPYLIDTTKEQMIMMYGGGDMAVCDGGIFEGSYVSTSAFKNGEIQYQRPSELQFGQVIDVTKQAPGAFSEVAEGTVIQTLEGARTVGKGEVVAFDHAGNPYIQPAKNVIKRNQGFSEAAAAILDRLSAES